MEVGSGLRKLATESFDRERRRSEIQEEAVLKTSRLQVTPTDREMDVFKATDRLEFYDDPLFDEKIETVFADLMVLVEKRNRFLTHELNPAQGKLDRERLLINGFEETRPEFAVNSNTCSDNPLGRLTIP